MIAVVNDWWHHMVRGEFADAWRVSDAILRQRRGEPCWHLPRHEQYVWDGRPLHGARVLVRCYHGLGDTIQFIRYAPLVQRIAREVIVWAQPALVPLLRGARAVDRLLPLHDGTPNCDFDVDVESMELAHVFRTTIDTIPRDVPYLHAPPLDVAALRPDASRIRVGIFWRVGDWDDRRSVPYSLLPKLADISGVDLYMVARDHECAAGTIPVTALPYPDDIYGTARIMRTLDLVITADSMPAHLAGALGVPTWTLLHARPDWRWMQDRDDSPWYPTMRLFRQQRAGDWDAVIDRVALALGRARVSCASAVRPR
jgi:hypothetical protein